jgi:hypothetical protein
MSVNNMVKSARGTRRSSSKPTSSTVNDAKGCHLGLDARRRRCRLRREQCRGSMSCGYVTPTGSFRLAALASLTLAVRQGTTAVGSNSVRTAPRPECADLETISFPGAAFGGRDALSAQSRSPERSRRAAPRAGNAGTS